MKSISREESRRLDEIAVRTFKIPSLILMENAGLNAANEIYNSLRAPSTQKVAVVCGKGHNGGDGFVIARHLHNRGVKVNVYTAGILMPLEPSPIPTDYMLNLEIIHAMGLDILEIGSGVSLDKLPMFLASEDIIIDAILGTGLNGKVKTPYDEIIEIINSVDAYKIAIDIPSGLDADRGVPLGIAVKAQKTITMAAVKKGMTLPEAKEYTGDIVTVDISLPRELLNE